MGSAIVPTQKIESIALGTTAVIDPKMLLKVNGLVYSNGYRIDYNVGYRNIFPAYDSNTGTVYLYSHAIAYGEDIPALTLTNIEVLLIG